MTVVFKIENISDQEFNYFSFTIKRVFFNTGDKKYPVIKDAEKNWLASTIAYGSTKKDIFSDERDTQTYNYFKLKPKAKKVGWMKFEKPQGADWPLDLSLSGVTPFTLQKSE